MKDDHLDQMKTDFFGFFVVAVLFILFCYVLGLLGSVQLDSVGSGSVRFVPIGLCICVIYISPFFKTNAVTKRSRHFTS